MNWKEFTAAAPEIARQAQEAFEDQHLAVLGTLRRDGWPRISPCEVYFVDGEMLLGMMPNSAKVEDLRRDPRITVVNGQESREPKRGDVKLYGRAREVLDRGQRDRFADAQEALISWRPPDHVPVFAVEIESAAYISFGEGRRLLRWTSDTGEQELQHPERGTD
jgi:predicted pyridoxine 5'-phosphate oxidase superfamily flavin-nucleotide-binding protein